MLRDIRSVTVVRSLTLPPCGLGRPDPRAAHVQTALRERWRGQPPASQRVASAVSLSAWWMGVVGDSWWLFVTNLPSEKLFRITPLPPPSTCSAAEPTHPTAAQGHNELAYKCWYAQLDAYSNAATVILAGERRRHSVDSRIAMRRTACPDARLGALLWCRRKASGRAAQARPSG